MAKKSKKAAKKSVKKAAAKRKATPKKKTVKKSLSSTQPDYSWVELCSGQSEQGPHSGRCFVFEQGKLPKKLKTMLNAPELKRVGELASGEPFVFFGKLDGDVVVMPISLQASKKELQGSNYELIAPHMGRLFKQLKSEKFDHISVEIELKKQEQVQAVVVGLDLSQYRFLDRSHDSFELPYSPSLELRWNGKKLTSAQISAFASLGRGINLARHLVNVPPNQLQPEHYESMVKRVFAKTPGLSIQVWAGQKLVKEKMNLLMAVGGASESAPRLVHIKYRPKGGASKKPVALVGKGITFDSGGLDLKPPQYMRLMKKDMGGSAAVLGALRWAIESGCKQPLDVYLSIAENSISDEAFRPSDVIESRKGLLIEIDNTDAEGRLVLADALDVACTRPGKEKPQMVVDVATLTGAAKVALGRSVGALFSNSSSLRDKLYKAGQKSGDLCWPMPLFQPYRKSLGSPFADFVNSGDAYGGSITAALFLESFVDDDMDWAHLDIYGWNDGPGGCLLEKGGSGQGVGVLVEFLSQL
ncbi:MAG: leucyl aminopeptidase family protein [Bdellovibrionales bacterium]|nr:leucyl aminopeptidase family protein [Bdellovibrionales bacterium]